MKAGSSRRGGREILRSTLRMTAGPLLLALLLSACGSAAPAAGSVPASVSASAGTAASGWDGVLAPAKKEGQVVLAGSPDESFRQTAAAAFQKSYGINLEYLPLAGAEVAARVQREAVAGKVSIDVMLGGSSALTTLLPQGLVDPIKPNLMLPEITDPSHWRDGKLNWMDDQQQYVLQLTESLPPILDVDPDVVQPSAIQSWKDLLKPDYKSKIVTFDPRQSGTGQGTASYLLEKFGPDFVRQLYLDQGVMVSSDERQVAEWVGRGTYPVGLGLVQRQIEPLRALGLKFARVFPSDGPGYLSGGTGVEALIKNRPHSNAGIVVANWLASREGQEVYAKAFIDVSRRTDTQVPEVPDYLKPQSGVDYEDTYEGSYYVKQRPQTQKLLADTLGR